MLLGKINEWNITLGDKLQEETMTLPVTISKQPFWFHLNIILPRLWKLKHRLECTLQSIIIILRYLHSCGKKTKLRQGCTPWYNMFDIHGFNPNSIKFSKNHLTFFSAIVIFILRHVKNLGRGELGNDNKSTKGRTPVGYGVRILFLSKSCNYESGRD